MQVNTPASVSLTPWISRAVRLTVILRAISTLPDTEHWQDQQQRSFGNG